MCRVPGAGLDHQITVPHSIGGTLVLTPWTRRRTCEPDPAMTREAMKEVAWALLGTEAEHVFRLCLFRRFEFILMMRDPGGSRKEALMGSRHGGPS